MFKSQKRHLAMVSALRTKLTQRFFSAMFFEIDKSNKLFLLNIEA